MVDIMNEQKDYDVDIGKRGMWVECYERAGMKSSKNVLRNGVRVMNALENSEFFEKRYTRLTSKVRWFFLKEEYKQ